MPYSTPTVPSSSGPHVLVDLPRRRMKSTPAFHFAGDAGSCSSDESDDEGYPQTGRAFPFPSRARSRSPSPPSKAALTPRLQARSNSVILLSNGKPLKSSLKSSSSSPHVTGLNHGHTRTRSAPSTPSLKHSSPSSSPGSSGASTPKSVHFPEVNHLTAVQTFRSRGKPASLMASDTETESEAPNSNQFPFPKSSAPLPSRKPQNCNYVLNADHVPSLQDRLLDGIMVLVESIKLDGLILRGTLLVRNISFEKDVVVRFTMDGWSTTSEVAGKYTASLSGLPSSINIPGAELPWDRFTFTINLLDYATTLASRTLYLAARYVAGGVEQWDNNSGKNYCVRFLKSSPTQPNSRTPQAATVPTSTPETRDSSRVHCAIALEKRLRRMSLSNYASPMYPATVPSPPSTHWTERKSAPEVMENLYRYGQVSPSPVFC